MKPATCNIPPASNGPTKGTRRTVAIPLIALMLAGTAMIASAEEKHDASPAAPASHATVLLRKPIGAIDAAEANLVRVDYPPGAASKPHRHPGPVLGYVLSGAIEFQVEGEPKRTLHAGNTFFEPAGKSHLISRNASTTEPASLIAYLLGPEDKPITTPLDGDITRTTK
jgi:quercetin dioxygenase-like cupin family protein